MGLRFARSLSGSFGGQQWRRSDGAIYLRCPICVKVHKLNPETHSVARDGRVTPSFACHACPFLDWIELDGMEAP